MVLATLIDKSRGKREREDGWEGGSGYLHEHEEEAVVEAGMVERVEDGEEDEADGTDDGEDD